MTSAALPAIALALLLPALPAVEVATVRAGPYGAAGTWGGTLPPAGADVVVHHALSVSAAVPPAASITVAGGGSLAVSGSGSLAASASLLISAGGSVNLSGGALSIGPAGGGDRTLTLSGGSLDITGGVLRVNGRMVLAAGTFSLHGGAIDIDPNGGTGASSVAAGIDVLAVASAVGGTVDGGTITFVDPPFSGTGRTFAFSGTSGVRSWVGSTLVCGGSGAPQASTCTVGFTIDTGAGDAGYVTLGHVVAAGGSSAARFLSGPVAAGHGFDVGGDLTVNAGSTARTFTGGGKLRIQGNLTSNGAYLDNAGIVFGRRDGPNTAHQWVTSPAGYHFGNDKGTLAKWFTSLEFDNIATPTAVSFALGGYADWNLDPATLPDAGSMGVDTLVDLRNGVVDIGGDNQWITLQGCTVRRTNGMLLRGPGGFKGGTGKGEWGNLFPAGASTRTYHIGTYNPDSADFDYSPVTVDMHANAYAGRAVSFYVVDRTHGSIDAGGTPGSHLSRYWNYVNRRDLGAYSATLTFAYRAEDLVGDGSALRLQALGGGSPPTWMPLPAAVFSTTAHTATVAFDSTTILSDGFDLAARAPAGSAGTIGFGSAAFDQIEGDGGSIDVAITVIRTGGTTGEASIAYATGPGGSATADADYVPTSGTLTWADGVGGAATFMVRITGDTAVETDETVPLLLSTPVGAGLARSSADLSIIDDDAVPPAPTITAIAPATGPVHGGTLLTITGTSLSGASAVLVGGAAASAVVVVDPTTVRCVSPAHAAGAVSVVLSAPGGTASVAGGFTYQSGGGTSEPAGSGDGGGGCGNGTGIAALLGMLSLAIRRDQRTTRH